MSKLQLTAEQQIERLNHIITKVEGWQSLDFETLTQRPDPKTWSPIEIIGHMNAAYHLYRDRIDVALDQIKDQEEANGAFQAGRKSSFFIRAISPRGTHRPMKMKTMKRFYPVFNLEELNSQNITPIFDLFFSNQEHLRQAIQKARFKQLRQQKIVSAIGPLVQFYLPEAFEFLIGHEERHLVQMDEVIAELKTLQLQ